MKRALLIFLLGLSASALADDAQDPDALQRALEPADDLTALPAPRGTPLLDVLYGIDVYGSLTVGYTANLAGVSGRAHNRFRLSDQDANAFSIPFARVGVRRVLSGYEEWDLGFGLELAAGHMVPDAFGDDGLFERSALNVPQAYIDLQLPTPLPVRVRAGRMYLPFGVESVDPAENPHFSHSFLETYMPRTVTGVSLGVDLSETLSYTQYVVNGWDQVVDENSAKTFAGQLAWRPSASALFTLDWIAGAEREDSNSDARWALQAGVRWQARRDVELRAAVLYGEENFTSPVPQLVGDVDAAFGGFTVSLKKSFLYDEVEGFHHLSFAVRGSYFEDEHGARTGLDQSLGEVTATLELRPIEAAAIRVEYRRDFSSRGDAFLGGRGELSRDAQDTLSFSVSAQF